MRNSGTDNSFKSYNVITLTLANNEPPIQFKLDMGNVCCARCRCTNTSPAASAYSAALLGAAVGIKENSGRSLLMFSEHTKDLASVESLSKADSLQHTTSGNPVKKMSEPAISISQ